MNESVCPTRLVLPLLPREATGPLEVLNLRSVGVLQVDVMQARGLPHDKGSWLSTVDPQVTSPAFVGATCRPRSIT